MKIAGNIFLKVFLNKNSYYSDSGMVSEVQQ